MDSTIVCLIRHGQTDWNKNKLIQGTIDNKLNSEGKKQALDTADLLKEIDIKWDLLMSSPLSRAVETMEIIRNSLYPDKEVIKNIDVIERDFGALEGKSVCKESYDLMFSGNVEGLEQIDVLENRAFNAMISIHKKYPNKKILITSHSQFIKGLLTKVDPNFDFTFVIKNTSLNFFKITNDKVTSLQYNVLSKDELNINI